MAAYVQVSRTPSTTQMVVRAAVWRPRSAKARNRGRWGASGCARHYGDLTVATMAIAVDCVGPAGGAAASAGLFGTTVRRCWPLSDELAGDINRHLVAWK